MPEAFNCPNCGAPLDYKGNDPIIRCPYCSGSVVVPDNLRSKPAFSATPHNFTLSGAGDLGGLIQQARRFKDIKELAQAGRMDDAVQIYREIMPNASEIEANTAVEALANGHPITLTNFGPQGNAVSVAQAVEKAVNQAQVYSPRPGVYVDTPPRKKSGGGGCTLGCAIVLLVLGILAATLLPTLGGLAGISVLFTELGLPTPEVSIININIPGLTGYGTQELAFGGKGTGAGLFNDVRALAVNPASGNIYAANYSDGRVQAFDPQGKFITQWVIKKGITDPYIQDMAADRQGNVYVAVLGKIMKFDGNGKQLATFTPPEMGHYTSVALTANGSMLAVSWGEDIFKLSADGKVVDTFPKAVSGISGDAELGAKIAVDGLGRMYLLAPFHNAVFVYDAEGKFLNRFGSQGDETGQFRAPSAIAVDGKGRIFVSDVQGVQVFSNDGRYLDVIKVQNFAFGLAFDDQGKLYITTNQNKVEKYSIKE